MEKILLQDHHFLQTQGVKQDNAVTSSEMNFHKHRRKIYYKERGMFYATVRHESIAESWEELEPSWLSLQL